MIADGPFHPQKTPWVVAIYGSESGGEPLGAGVVIDSRRLLTCAHVVLRDEIDRENLWVAFPFAKPRAERRYRADPPIAPGDGELDEDQDVALLVLDEPVPAGVAAASQEGDYSGWR